jgi:hypothetical protein
MALRDDAGQRNARSGEGVVSGMRLLRVVFAVVGVVVGVTLVACAETTPEGPSSPASTE